MGKTALLHYWLTNWRGGENVFAEIAGLFPEADIFTHAYRADLMASAFGSHRVRESFIGALPGARSHCQRYLPLMPLALRRLDLAGYDLIISSESGPVKGVTKPAGAIHICYCHTPMRYIWDMYDEYYRSAGLAGKIGMRVFCSYLRRYDRASARGVDRFIANSRFVAERIRRIYGRDADVVHPPVDTEYFSSLRTAKQDFYLLAGQLVAYKHPELAVLACTQMKRRLIVTGTGPLLNALREIAGPTVEFTGRVSKEQLREYYTRARALIFPGTEDFGIVPVESQAAGTPVIAFGAGGALETVLPGKTGIFFDTPTAAGLGDALRRFETLDLASADCKDHAAGFAPERFRSQFMRLVKQAQDSRLQ